MGNNMRKSLSSGKSGKRTLNPIGPMSEGTFAVKQPILKNGLRGGAITSKNSTLLPMGSFSMIQNMRPTHPGFTPRLGQIRQHETADGTNQVMTLYQFSKGRKAERHVYGQFSDGDILEAETSPPGVATGVFGSEVFNGSTGQMPASWSTIRDSLLFSNGVNQHQIFSGDSEYVDKVVIVTASAPIPKIPSEGQDVTKDVTDGSTTSYADLSGLDDLTNNNCCVFIKTKLRARALNFTIKSPNNESCVLELNYYNGSWTDVTISDGTDDGGETLAQSGQVSWTPQSDEEPCYMFGENGWWYQLHVADSDSLGSACHISSITFESNFQSIENLWDGVSVDIIEFQHYVYSGSGGTYKNYAANMVTLSDMVATNDKGYFSSYDNIIGIYVDVGSTPNTQETATIDHLYAWTGSSFTEVSNLNDGTDGFTKSGWITWDRVTTAQQSQFNDLPYFAYWFYFTVSANLSESITCTVRTMPFFDITDFGSSGLCNAAWKDRALYSYDDNIIHVSAAGKPQVLNGTDYCTLEAGDGRSNRILCMMKFHNELMVWQEEKGDEGGCLTLFEGYSPSTFGKLVLSTKHGIMNAKCAVVIDGSNFTTSTMANVQTIAFFLSRSGVFASSGTAVTDIDEDIKNYFDPTKDECIRRGYESQMWLKYDSSCHCLRLGLVSGSTATTPNVFPVYDLVDNTWSFDELTPELSCMAEVEAESGTGIMCQIGGGVDDGRVYVLNTGDDDQGTGIDAYLMIEFQLEGIPIELDAVALRVRAQESGEITLTPYINGVTDSDYVRTLSMKDPDGNEDHLVVRQWLSFAAIRSSHLSLKIGHDKADETFALESIIIDMIGCYERNV